LRLERKVLRVAPGFIGLYPPPPLLLLLLLLPPLPVVAVFLAGGIGLGGAGGSPPSESPSLRPFPGGFMWYASAFSSR